ncbi:c-type cytochrome [Polymorphum gilvum]|uniref:Gluconate 2-dehydrogenase, cytochrome c subunit n=1 Tax=Polymorphum gilvum (strain LMG 25793 / CGMCC 1.9160 / SL003B-26A1) TaxID=991905 RepID=F2J3I1_POLGS|nr:cytochrome c [Polymorphum gilvum]ADZ71006.1 Gluconate 2-dehydrogenase, cytochrome c subunit [Polymorphum gilvum SL003B-26A1]
MKSEVFPLLMLASLATAPALAGDPSTDLIERGKYLATIMDCAGCHMPRGNDGTPVVEAGLSGGTVGFEIPGLGIFWPPNLTPDPSGLGGWTDAEIAAAITGGVARDGRMLAPAMPWPSYAALAPEDLHALVAYLRALPPVKTPRLDPVTEAAAAPAPFYRVALPQN